MSQRYNGEKNIMVAIILVAPQMGENIGASARVMKNFGLNDLRIINPRDGWPNEKAEKVSVGAFDILHNAKIYQSVKEAVADLEYVYATTAAERDLQKENIFLGSLTSDRASRGKAGILFGRENHGLSNEEILYANKIITIDTVQEFSSLNLAQAIAVVCYQLFDQRSTSNFGSSEALVKQAEKEHFYDLLFDNLENKDFFQNEEKKQHMMAKIRNIFARVEHLSSNELRILIGIIKTLSK